MKKTLSVLIMIAALLALGGCCWCGPGGFGGPHGGGGSAGGGGGPGMFSAP